MNIIKKNIDKKEKEKTLNIEKIKVHIKYLREDRYDSIYNEELRDELRREIEENQEIELEEEIEKMEEFYDR